MDSEGVHQICYARPLSALFGSYTSNMLLKVPDVFFQVQEICLRARVNWALPWPVCKKVRGTARSWMEDPPASNWRLIVRSERASDRLFAHVQATA